MWNWTYSDVLNILLLMMYYICAVVVLRINLNLFFSQNCTVGATSDSAAPTNRICKGGWFTNRPNKYYL